VLAKVAAAGVAMAITSWGIEAALAGWLPGRQVLMRAIRLIAAIGGGIAVLAAAARLLRIEEFNEALAVWGGTKVARLVD
jgi:hypothetical protein